MASMVLTSCLFADHPLATDFLIGDGNVTFTVPDVPMRHDYIVVCAWFPSPSFDLQLTPSSVFGNSGNASPTFTIMPSQSM